MPTVLPDNDDCWQFVNNIAVLFARILVKHLTQFSDLSGCVHSHIEHKFSESMSHKSSVVS